MDRTRLYYAIALGVVVFFVLCVSVAGAATFTMERKNASMGAFVAISDGDVVYRGDTVRFTASGGAGWNWTLGDGATVSGVSTLDHNYTYGAGRIIIMHDGYYLLPITLKTLDGVQTTQSINFTTLLPPLVFQTAHSDLLDESLAENYTEALTGNRTAPPGWSGFGWVLGVSTTIRAYTSVLTVPIFLILVFSIPFIMEWIIMKDFIVAGILGGFLGIFIIVRLPAALQPIAVAFIVMSLVAIIYSLLKET